MKFLLIPILILSIQFCMVTSVRLSDKPVVSKKPGVSITSHFWFGGIFQSNTIDLVEECFGEEPLLVKERFGILSYLSLGIYTPRISDIYCEK